MNLWTIILAAGLGSRLGHLPDKKQFLVWKDRPLFWHSVLTFSRLPLMQGIILVFAASECSRWEQDVSRLRALDNLGLDLRLVPGGATRQDSARSGLASLPKACDTVLIHDAARPFASAALIKGIVDRLAGGSEAVVPGIQVTDTIKQLHLGQLQTLPRKDLYAIQTPQGFSRATIDEAHQRALEHEQVGTDDAALVEILGKSVTLAPGDEDNVKITTASDLHRLRQTHEQTFRTVTAWGYDVHRFGPGRPMKLGGIPITNGPQVLAHSDGDVLLHAVIDAILGCLGRGDIGDLFPDTDPRLENANSGVLLAEVLKLAERTSLCLDHLDATVICQRPKLSPWKRQIRSSLAGLLDLSPDRINVKATTEEGLGFTGKEEGIKAVALLTAHYEGDSADKEQAPLARPKM